MQAYSCLIVELLLTGSSWGCSPSLLRHLIFPRSTNTQDPLSPDSLSLHCRQHQPSFRPPPHQDHVHPGPLCLQHGLRDTVGWVCWHVCQCCPDAGMLASAFDQLLLPVPSRSPGRYWICLTPIQTPYNRAYFGKCMA